MEGKIIRENEQDVPDLPKFGHEMRDKHFSFEKGYINLNHGGRGATPKPVMQAKLKWMGRSSDICSSCHTSKLLIWVATEMNEAAPDRFAQQIYYKELPKVREAIAPMLNAEPDNLAL